MPGGSQAGARPPQDVQRELARNTDDVGEEREHRSDRDLPLDHGFNAPDVTVLRNDVGVQELIDANGLDASGIIVMNSWAFAARVSRTATSRCSTAPG